LRSTLTKNTKWSIKTVKFTNQGKTIELWTTRRWPPKRYSAGFLIQRG
jgi:hypothetical protein